MDYKTYKLILISKTIKHGFKNLVKHILHI